MLVWMYFNAEYIECVFYLQGLTGLENLEGFLYTLFLCWHFVLRYQSFNCTTPQKFSTWLDKASSVIVVLPTLSQRCPAFCSEVFSHHSTLRSEMYGYMGCAGSQGGDFPLAGRGMSLFCFLRLTIHVCGLSQLMCQRCSMRSLLTGWWERGLRARW